MKFRVYDKENKKLYQLSKEEIQEGYFKEKNFVLDLFGNLGIVESNYDYDIGDYVSDSIDWLEKGKYETTFGSGIFSNGIEIFEGDIVKATYTNRFVIGEVKFEYGQFKLEEECGFSYSLERLEEFGKIEILSNKWKGDINEYK